MGKNPKYWFIYVGMRTYGIEPHMQRHSEMSKKHRGGGGEEGGGGFKL